MKISIQGRQAQDFDETDAIDRTQITAAPVAVPWLGASTKYCDTDVIWIEAFVPEGGVASASRMPQKANGIVSERAANSIRVRRHFPGSSLDWLHWW